MTGLASEDAANAWFAGHDPGEVAFAYIVVSQSQEMACMRSLLRSLLRCGWIARGGGE